MTEIQIVELPRLRVVSALGFGREPEDEAWNLIGRFADDKNIDQWSGEQRFFGFNNPNPSPGSPNYGYEQWMTVGPDVTADAPYEIKEVHPGRYATTRFTGLSRITDTWKELVRWFESEGHTISPHPERCLEEFLPPFGESPEKWTFALYLGIDD